MTGRTIPRGQWTAPIFAAESYVGSRYYVATDGGDFSAHPGDYWMVSDDANLGALMRRDFPHRTVTGRTVYADRYVGAATLRNLRRLTRAAASLVR